MTTQETLEVIVARIDERTMSTDKKVDGISTKMEDYALKSELESFKELMTLKLKLAEATSFRSLIIGGFSALVAIAGLVLPFIKK